MRVSPTGVNEYIVNKIDRCYGGGMTDGVNPKANKVLGA